MSKTSSPLLTRDVPLRNLVKFRLYRGDQYVKRLNIGSFCSGVWHKLGRSNCWTLRFPVDEKRRRSGSLLFLSKEAVESIRFCWYSELCCDIFLFFYAIRFHFYGSEAKQLALTKRSPSVVGSSTKQSLGVKGRQSKRISQELAQRQI